MGRAETLSRVRLCNFSPRSGWRDLWLAGLGVVLLALLIPGCDRAAGTGEADEQALAELPGKAREALDRAAEVYPGPLKGARWSKPSTRASKLGRSATGLKGKTPAG